MSNILKIKQFPEVEKCKIIQHLKNEIRIIGDEFKTNNIDLLIHVMNFVEMYFTGHKMGKVKEEVVRRVLDKFTADFLDQMIPFVLEKKLLIPKSIINTILNFFKKKKFTKQIKSDITISLMSNSTSMIIKSTTGIKIGMIYLLLLLIALL